MNDPATIPERAPRGDSCSRPILPAQEVPCE